MHTLKHNSMTKQSIQHINLIETKFTYVFSLPSQDDQICRIMCSYLIWKFTIDYETKSGIKTGIVKQIDGKSVKFHRK